MSKRKKTKSVPDKNLIAKFHSSILELLGSQPGRAYSINQIVKKLGLKKRDDIKTATVLIYELEESGKIKEHSNGTYSSNKSEIGDTAGGVTGIVDHVNARFAYV